MNPTLFIFIVTIASVAVYVALVGLTIGLFDRHCCDDTEDHSLAGIFWPVTLLVFAAYVVVALPAQVLYSLASGKK